MTADRGGWGTGLGGVCCTKRYTGGNVIKAVQVLLKVSWKSDGFLFQHLLDSQFGAQPNALDVDLHHLFEHMDAFVLDTTGKRCDAGIIDQDIEPCIGAERNARIDRSFEVGFRGDVESLEVSVSTEFIDQLVSGNMTRAFATGVLGAERVRLQVCTENASAGASEVQCGLPADARGGASDECGSTYEAERRRKRFCEFGKRHDQGVELSSRCWLISGSRDGDSALARDVSLSKDSFR